MIKRKAFTHWTHASNFLKIIIASRIKTLTKNGHDWKVSYNWPYFSHFSADAYLFLIRTDPSTYERGLAVYVKQVLILQVTIPKTDDSYLTFICSCFLIYVSIDFPESSKRCSLFHRTAFLIPWIRKLNNKIQ